MRPPEATLDCIERIISKWTRERLLAFRESRQCIVWSLERIAVWPPYFRRAARVLLKLAAAENANNGNNASGTFADLFSLAWGPMAQTEATPDQRFPALREALESPILDERRLGLRACKAALAEPPTSKIVGPEYQGIRPTPRLWSPTLWEDLFQAYSKVWGLLREMWLQYDNGLRNEASQVLLDAGLRLIRFPSLAAQVLETVDEISKDPAVAHAEVVRFITRARRFNSDVASAETLEHLRRIDASLTGTTFASRLRRIVLNSNFDEEDDEGQAKLLEGVINSKVNALAIEAISSPKQLLALVGELVRADGFYLYQFGVAIGAHDSQQIFLEPFILAQQEAGPSGTTLLLAGYLRAIREKNVAEWEHILISLFDRLSHKPFAVEIACRTGTSDAVVCQVMTLLKNGAITAKHTSHLAYNPEIPKLNESTARTAIQVLRSVDCIDSAMYWTVAFYCNKSKNRPIPKDLGLALLTDPKVFVDSHQQMLDYNWQVVAEHFIDEYPEGGFEILRALVQQHADWRISLRIGHGGFRTIARQIIRLDPIRSWEIVSQMIECLRKIDLFGIGHWLGDNELFGGTKTASLLCEFPLDLILRWAGEEPASRALFVAGVHRTQDHGTGSSAVCSRDTDSIWPNRRRLRCDFLRFLVKWLAGISQ